MWSVSRDLQSRHSTPSASGKLLLDINVATPNGVSNHLLIAMQPARPGHEWSSADSADDPDKSAVPPQTAAKEAKPKSNSSEGSKTARQTAQNNPETRTKRTSRRLTWIINIDIR